MGGANTEINDHTVDVLIESAYFCADQHPAHQQGAGPAQRIQLPLRARRGRGHLRLGQPARGAIDSGNRRRPIGRGRGGCVSAARASRSKLRCISPSQRTCWASAFPTRNRLRFLTKLGLDHRPAGTRRMHLQHSVVARGFEARSGFDRGSRAACTAWTKSPPRRRAAPLAPTRLIRSMTRLPRRAAF